MKELSSMMLAGVLSISAVQAAQNENPLQSMQLIKGQPVFSSPYLGERSDFEAFDLIVNIPNNNRALSLLEQIQNAENRLAKQGYSLPNQPTIDLSGQLRVGIDVTENESQNNELTPSFRLSDAEIDIFARINSMSLAFFNLSYADSPVNNTNVYLDQGFVTLGNLNTFPAYLAAGQMYMPFGGMSSSTIAGAMTHSMQNIKKRGIMLGYKQSFAKASINVAGYGYESAVDSSKKDGGLHLSLSYDDSISVVAGLTSNIYETNLFQQGAGQFTGFIKKAPAKKPERVAGISGSLNLSYAGFSVQGEFVRPVQELNTTIFPKMDDKAVVPLVVNAEVSTPLKLKSYPVQAAVGYAYSKDALIFGLPKHRITASVITQLFSSTIAGIGFTHIINYASSDNFSVLANYYTEREAADADSDVVTVTGSGTSHNEINIFFGYYF